MSEPILTKADIILCKLAEKREKSLGRNDIKPQRRIWLWCTVVALGLAAIFDKRKKRH